MMSNAYWSNEMWHHGVGYQLAYNFIDHHCSGILAPKQALSSRSRPNADQRQADNDEEQNASKERAFREEPPRVIEDST